MVKFAGLQYSFQCTVEEEGRVVFRIESPNHLYVFVHFDIHYIIHYSIQYIVKENLQYSWGRRLVFTTEWVISTSNLYVCPVKCKIQHTVFYKVQCTLKCSVFMKHKMECTIYCKAQCKLQCIVQCTVNFVEYWRGDTEGSYPKIKGQPLWCLCT